ncbi:hypothetical protein Efla_006994 [Eimeria flavescens]
MKGRWRKDKRVAASNAAKEGGSGGGREAQTPDRCLQGFSFSASSRAEEAQRACLENAHSSLVRSQFAMCDGQTHDDFMKALTGGSICIPSFFDSRESSVIFKKLLEELTEYDKRHEASACTGAEPDTPASQPAAADALPANGLCRWSRHLKHENPEGFPTFQKVVKRLSSHFDLDIYATRMNIYPDGSHWKPHHHDSHAYSSERNQAEDFTVGASFGSQRVLEFAHVKSGIKFTFPQANGSIFAFNSLVNRTFTHGVPAEPKDVVGPRISIIVWGRRRSLNELNACESELKGVRRTPGLRPHESAVEF